jgi:hypothetical protein
VNQTIAWDVLPAGWDGFALLADDVERYVGIALNFSLAAFDPSIPHFFRLAVSDLKVISYPCLMRIVHIRGRSGGFYDACNIMAE